VRLSVTSGLRTITITQGSGDSRARISGGEGGQIPPASRRARFSRPQTRRGLPLRRAAGLLSKQVPLQRRAAISRLSAPRRPTPARVRLSAVRRYLTISYMVTPRPLGQTPRLTGLTNLVVEGTKKARLHASAGVAKKAPVQTNPSQTPAPSLAKTK
jgi:hypothetical protein